MDAVRLLTRAARVRLLTRAVLCASATEAKALLERIASMFIRLAKSLQAPPG